MKSYRHITNFKFNLIIKHYIFMLYLYCNCSASKSSLKHFIEKTIVYMNMYIFKVVHIF